MWTIYEELKAIKSFRIMLLESEDEVNAREATKLTIKCKNKSTK